MSLNFGQPNVTFSELRVWTQARSPAQIQAGFESIIPPQPGLLAFYDFREQSGSVAFDSSEHENRATLTGSWQWENTPPHLDWVRSDRDLIMSWPADMDFVLESTDNFTSWTEATDLPVQVVNGRNTVTANTSVGTRFFRLAIGD